MNVRRYHIAATSLMIAGLAAGGVSWGLNGTMFWIAVGISGALVLGGLVFAGRIPRDKKDDTAKPRNGPGVATQAEPAKGPGPKKR